MKDLLDPRRRRPAPAPGTAGSPAAPRPPAMANDSGWSVPGGTMPPEGDPWIGVSPQAPADPGRPAPAGAPAATGFGAPSQAPAAAPAGSFQLSADVTELLRVLLAQWRLVLVLTLVGTLAGFVATRLLPAEYQAKVALLPSVPADGLGTMGLGQVAGLASNLGLNLGAPAVSMAYPDIIRSRQVEESILDRPYATARGRMSLQEFLRPKGKTAKVRRAKALRELKKRVRVGVDKLSGVIQLTVLMREPKLAAQVAGDFVHELARVEEQLRLNSARYNKQFIEQRLSETAASLREAEEALENFREQNLRIGKDPELLMEAARLERELRIQEQIYLTLTQQHELAKIEEQRRGAGFEIIDPPREPLYKASPILVKNLVLGAFFGGLTACVLVIAASWIGSGRRLWNPRTT